MSRSMLCAALLSVAALAAGTASAQIREADQRVVSARGVNFEDVTQVRFFYAKLSAAAHAVCTSDYDDPLIQIADRACQVAALDGAVEQVDKPLLNRISGHRRVELVAHNGDTARPQAALVVSGLDQ
ncbi:MAG: UrcA family protein [Asticcacaulis sp.]|uniref:UrcA family protein n=1 Tax=Asticcacaulis sp. TaxID=1872648 RepID=UPI0039E64A78